MNLGRVAKTNKKKDYDEQKNMDKGQRRIGKEVFLWDESKFKEERP